MSDDSLCARALEAATEPDRIRTLADGVDSHLAADASGHDLDHAWRVFLLGTRLALAVGADAAAVQPAALVHDLHRTIGEPGDHVHPTESLDAVRAQLDRAGYGAARIEAVCHCVAVHDEYDYRGIEHAAETLEAEVLRDADNLDAMGAVGVARCFAFTALAGEPLWDPSDNGHSGLGHFDDKLLQLVDEMHTDPARELAEERHAFLESFKAQFEAEWFGET